MEQMVIKVPSEVATSLIEEGIAEELEPVTYNGPDIISLLTLVTDATVATATLIIGRDSIGEFVKNFVRKVSRNHQFAHEITVTVKKQARSEILTEINTEEGISRLAARIEMTIETTTKSWQSKNDVKSQE